MVLATVLLFIAKRIDKIEKERPVRNFIKHSATYLRGERFKVLRIFPCISSTTRSNWFLVKPVNR